MAVETQNEAYVLSAKAEVLPYKDGSAEQFLAGYKSLFGGIAQDPTNARVSFINTEVDLLWEVHDDIFVPSKRKSDIFFAGKWRDHSPDLQVRVSRADIALAKKVSGPNCRGYWFHSWSDKGSHMFETYGPVPLNEIVKATGLATEFVEAVEKHLTVYS